MIKSGSGVQEKAGSGERCGLVGAGGKRYNELPPSDRGEGGTGHTTESNGCFHEVSQGGEAQEGLLGRSEAGEESQGRRSIRGNARAVLKKNGRD